MACIKRNTKRMNKDHCRAAATKDEIRETALSSRKSDAKIASQLEIFKKNHKNFLS